MKAFVMKEIGSVGYSDKPVPRPGRSDAIVLVKPLIRF
jgi:hypothetical protein